MYVVMLISWIFNVNTLAVIVVTVPQSKTSGNLTQPNNATEPTPTIVINFTEASSILEYKTVENWTSVNFGPRMNQKIEINNDKIKGNLTLDEMACHRSTFCSNRTSNYTDHQIDVLVTKHLQKFKNFFNIEKVDLEVLTRNDMKFYGYSIQPSNSPPIHSETFCSSKEGWVYPKRALAVEGVWYDIVNTQNFSQAVAVEICDNPHEKCSNLLDVLPRSYSTECRQKFSAHRLVMIDENGELNSAQFKLPSCCKCYFTFNP